MGKNFRSIGDVSKLVGIHVRTLRYLHERGYVSTTWDEIGGRRIRIYDDEAVKMIVKISELMREGFPPAIAAKKAAGNQGPTLSSQVSGTRA